MKLLVGLGNSGKNYLHTRHNVGAMAISALGQEYANTDKRYFAKIGWLQKADIAGVACTLFWPECYMNEIGKFVAAAQKKTYSAVEDILLFQDELDLPFASVRAKQGGGANGHNGVKSVDGLVGKNTWRVRLGIGRPIPPMAEAAFVLQNFKQEEMQALPELFCKLAAAMPHLLQGKLGEFHNHIKQTIN